jgi:hypothetical protein
MFPIYLFLLGVDKKDPPNGLPHASIIIHPPSIPYSMSYATLKVAHRDIPWGFIHSAKLHLKPSLPLSSLLSHNFHIFILFHAMESVA